MKHNAPLRFLLILLFAGSNGYDTNSGTSATSAFKTLQKDIAATKADADKSLKALFLQDTRYFNSLYSLFKVSHNA
jgi:hypothetical protein